jgi:hypothetical protein
MALVKLISEENIASIIRVTGIGKLGTLAVTSSRSTLRRNIVNVVPSSQILVILIM